MLKNQSTFSNIRRSALIQHHHLTHRLRSLLLIVPTMSFIIVFSFSVQNPVQGHFYSFHVSISTFNVEQSLSFFLSFLTWHFWRVQSVTLLNDIQFVVDWYFLKITFRFYILGRHNTQAVLCSSQWIIWGTYHVNLSHCLWYWLYHWVKLANY